MFSCSVINSIVAIILKTINDARKEIFRKHIFKMKWLAILDGELKMTFNLRYGKVLSIVFCGCFLISNDFLSKNRKTQTNSFFGTTQIFGCFINTLPKYILMERSKFFEGALSLCFQNFVLISEFQNAEFYKKSKKSRNLKVAPKYY